MLQSIEDVLQAKLVDYDLKEIRTFSMKSQYENGDAALHVIPMQLIEIAMLAIAVIILVGGLVAVTCALTYQSKRQLDSLIYYYYHYYYYNYYSFINFIITIIIHFFIY